MKYLVSFSTPQMLSESQRVRRYAESLASTDSWMGDCAMSGLSFGTFTLSDFAATKYGVHGLLAGLLEEF